MKEIRSSQPDWFSQLIQTYRSREAVRFIDDKEYGINLTDSLLAAGLRGNLCYNEWIAVLLMLGVSGFGVWMIVAAILDPEPTSKLGLLVGAGAILVFSGSGTAIWILTNLRPPNVRVSPSGVEISWEAYARS
jgi:hypothetical protein